ncbi:CU044_5270 family protein [Kutzneria chonburiensis]|uniref:CU044_5270 family protein n=1 Tax=Kutzneria chonburiensis TaxID=1483604 RepID=A0ABV6MMU2_9PSEU|nr:CU044_5270 family protein [Kutzneria chonburiensis]
MRDGLRPAEDGVVKRAVSELPEMSDEAFTAGRAKLLARMGRAPETAPVQAESAPVVAESTPAVPETPAAVPVAGAPVVPAAAAAPGAAPAAVVPLQRRRRGHVAWLVAAAVVVGVMVVALVGPSVVPHGDGPEPRIGSAVAAEALSQAASKTGDVVLQPGQFLYVRNRAISGGSGNGPGDDVKYLYLQDEVYETWVPADQAQTWEHRRTSSGRKTFLKGSAADLSTTIPDPMVLGDWKARDGAFFGDKEAANFEDPTPAYLAALPRDPKQLYTKLRAEAAGDEGIELLRRIQFGLDTGLIPTDLRKAVFQALAYLPDLKVVGQDVDLDGRHGQAFGLVHDSQLEELIIDTTTGQYLGSRVVLTADWHGIKAGTQLSSTSLTTKVVDAMGQQ